MNDDEASAASGDGKLRQWVLSWLFSSFWLGLMPPILAVTYYAIRSPANMDPALAQLRLVNLAGALQVGAESCSVGVGVGCSNLGLNAENAGFDKARDDLWRGTLHRTQGATYLAWFRGDFWPEVLTTFRNVKPDGQISFGEMRNGREPIVWYLFFCVMVGGGASIFFKGVRFLKARKASRG